MTLEELENQQLDSIYLELHDFNSEICHTDNLSKQVLIKVDLNK